jgi:chromosome partitioning protein
LLGRLRDPFAAGARRAKDKPFLEAAMAAAAFISATDEVVGLGRRHALDQILDGVARLKDFEVQTAVALFDDYVRHFRSAPDRARVRALKAIAAAGDRPEAAELLLRIAAAMARAEGEVSAEAHARVDKIARSLGVAAPEALHGAPPEVSPGTPQGTPLGTSDYPGPEGAAPFDGVAPSSRPTVIVLGNEKGGTGKSTTAMHLAVALATSGHKVGCLDLDGRQATLSRYATNRKAFAKKHALRVAMPAHRCIQRSEARDRREAEREETARLEAALLAFKDCRFIVIDTPGNDSHLCRLGHACADALITPLNDSFVDIDVLAQIDRDRREVIEPSPYAQMIEELNRRRADQGRAPIEWIVMRNRVAQLDTRNTREMAGLLERLSGRLGFRIEPGLSERVVFRELFYHGLTLLDLPEDQQDPRAETSRRRARGEVHDLLRAIGAADA